jgi:Flagellar motor protein
MRDRKKPEEPQEEGAPAWMNTYGDMVTLLLTFFVLLFSFSTISIEKWRDIVYSLSGVGVVAIPALDPNATADPGDAGREGKFIITVSTPAPSEASAGASEEMVNGMNADDIQHEFDELYKKIKIHIEDNNLGYILNVEYTDEYTVLLRMSDGAFFDPGSAMLDEDAKQAIKEVGDILTEYTALIRIIYIEGHTDNVPIHNGKYEDNWDLSYGRAKMVRDYLVSLADLEQAQLVPVSCGEYYPVASNDTVEGRAQNRRVDFVIESILKDQEG